MDRRNFLKKIIKAFFFSISVSLIFILSYIYPSKIKQKKLFYIYLIEEEDLPKSGIKRFEYKYDLHEKTIVSFVFLKKDGDELTAFSPLCTHLGCLVKWNNIEKEFVCVCHGGKFDMDGKVIAGPPPKPLERLPLDIRDGKVYIGIKLYG